MLNNNNILLADAGYDSNKIKNKVTQIKLGYLLSDINIRNTKDLKKIEAKKLSLTEKKLLKNVLKLNTQMHN